MVLFVKQIKQFIVSFLRFIYRRLTSLVLTRPTLSFFLLMGALFALIVFGSLVRQPAPTQQTVEVQPKPVTIYSIGEAPKIQVQGTVQKTGVVKIIAQSSGVVQKIYKNEGEKIRRGNTLVWLSTNYQGGTIPSVSLQIAETSYEFNLENYNTQKDLIAKRRELAEKMHDQTEDLRDIAANSLKDTRNVISINEDILKTLDEQLIKLQQNDVDGSNADIILQVKQGKAGVLAALASLQSAVKNTEYQTDEGKAPTGLANLQKDLTIKQLDLEEKSVDLNKEISGLNLKVAQISQSLMYPSSPVDGTVERVYVQVGQTVNPGQPLVQVTGNSNSATVVVTVSDDVTRKLSRLDKSIVYILSEPVELTLRYVSREPTDGQLHSLVFDIPVGLVEHVDQNSSVVVELPIGSADTNSIVPTIPLDAVYQSQTDSYIFVAFKDTSGSYQAKSRSVSLGQVYGSYVEVTEGLEKGELVIASRNVVDSDPVSF